MTRVAILAQFPPHLLPLDPPVTEPRGHYATWLPQLANAFGSMEDLEIHWLALTTQIATRTDVVWNNQHFHLLPTAAGGRALSLFRKDRQNLASVLREIRPDLVHGWGTEDVYALAAATSGYPNMVSMQGILSEYVLRSKMHPREVFQALIELWVLRKAGRITTESEWGRRLLLRRAPRAKVDLVEYGVHDDFLPVRWTPDAGTPSAIYIGSISPRKGVQDAVAAFAHPSLAEKQLWIVGGDSGRWGYQLAARSGPNVRWLGRKSRAQTADLLARAWCLVLPTRADTSPNVVKEARVIGLPVITSPHGGQTTYIQDGGAGVLVECGDIPALTTALADLLGSLARAQEVGAVDHARHRELLQPALTATGFAKLYRE